MNQTTAPPPDAANASSRPDTTFPRVVRLPFHCPLPDWAGAEAVGVEGAYYTASLDRFGRVARTVAASVMVHVTPRGHWYRSDDIAVGRSERTCRGCGMHGCFDFTLDTRSCAHPASAQDIATALLGHLPRKPARMRARVRFITTTPAEVSA